MRLWFRLYKLSLLSGVILAAPLLVGTAWYAWSAFATVDRYRRASDAKRGVDAEMFQIALHDELRRDLQRLRLAERPAHGRLPTFALSLPRASIDELSAQLGKGGDPKYVKGLLEKDGRIHKVQVRYRGGQPWHALGAQKSLKVHLEAGDLIQGVRVFNLINDPTPFGLEDELILDLAREEGLLTPEYEPVWVRLNNHDMGVYRFESQPDETLVRHGRRVPGNMYSGDADEIAEKKKVGGAGALFSGPEGWQKIASRTSSDSTAHPELDRFLAAINGASHQAFADYAEAELDLPRFATVDALDVVFGGSEHDWLSNHKIYADPYRGKLEPVAWSFRGFAHEERFNAVDHPLLIRLKLTPGYLAMRDRKVYELLTGAASLPSIRERTDKLMSVLGGELAADPYWDAYKLLPRASRYHRFFPRPMSVDRWLLSAAFELETFATRARWLLDALEAPGLEVAAGAFAESGGAWVARVDLRVTGHAAWSLRDVRAVGRCKGQVALHADVDLDGALRGDPAIARAPLGESARPYGYTELHAAEQLVARPDPRPSRGRVLVDEEPATFTYFVSVTGCAPESAALVLESPITGASTRVAVGGVGSAPLSREGESWSGAASVPAFAAGERSAHPWSFAQPRAPAAVALGPGEVRFESSRVFGEGETVTIAAGTKLALGPGASLIFHGKVTARGTAAEPIEVVRLDPSHPYGGIALLGPGTAGSRLSDMKLAGGSKASYAAVELTAQVNLHDTSDVALEDVTISGGEGSSDVVHAYQVDGLALHEVVVERAPVDGIDLEFVTAELRGVRVVGAGDDCVDLMGSKLQMQDGLLAACTNNGISAGEETELTANGVVVADAKTGLLVKNASQVRILRSLLFRTKRGLRARREQLHYGGGTRIGVSEVFVAASDVPVDQDKHSTIESAQVITEMPQGSQLEHLRAQVLRIASWVDLGKYLEVVERGGREL